MANNPIGQDPIQRDIQQIASDIRSIKGTIEALVHGTAGRPGGGTAYGGLLKALERIAAAAEKK
jgi:hypothetical protein